MSIKARELSFHYPARAGEQGFRLRLDSWTVEHGSSAVLFGPSGCGKSTLLNLISGALVANSGALVVEGLDLSGANETQRRAHRIRKVGFVFQDYPLVDYLDALGNVLFPFRLNPALRLNAAARDRAQGLLVELGLEHRQHHKPARLSQGERQRVALARALVTEPSLILADEPTAGLDPARSAAVLDLLDELRRQRGLTLVVVTHDHALLDRFDQRLDVGPLSGGAP